MTEHHRSGDDYFVIASDHASPEIQLNHAQGINLALRRTDEIARVLETQCRTLVEIKNLLAAANDRLGIGDKTMTDLRTRIGSLEEWRKVEEESSATRRRYLFEWFARPLGQAAGAFVVGVIVLGFAVMLLKVHNDTTSLVKAVIEDHRKATAAPAPAPAPPERFFEGEPGE